MNWTWRDDFELEITPADDRQTQIAVVRTCGPEAFDQAMLIAAAPELLQLVRCYWQSKSEEQWKSEEPEIHAAILAVMAKAERSAVA